MGFFLVHNLSQDFLPHIFLDYSVCINWFRRCLFNSMKKYKSSPFKKLLQACQGLIHGWKKKLQGFSIVKDNVEKLCKVFQVISDREKMSSFPIINIRIRRKSVFITVDFYEGKNYNIWMKLSWKYSLSSMYIHLR